MTTSIIRDLGEGLVLRRATVDDTEQMVAFHAGLHADDETAGPDECVAAWTRDLMSGQHPTFRPEDFTVVEDARTGQIVSSMCLISQTWTYEGIPFGVGQPELVATHPDYRRRGLIRAQFDVIHGWSADRGELVQGITGIPNFYRQFGYEMAIDLDGGRRGYRPQVPQLKEGETEPYRLRPATEADIGFMCKVYETGCRRGPVACVRNEELWRYELVGKSEKSVNRLELAIIEALDGERLGYLAHVPRLWGKTIPARSYELKPGVSWLAVTPTVVRYLWSKGESYAARDGGKDLATFFLELQAEHPAYEVLRSRLPMVHPAYAWYLRVKDVCGFVRHVAPALETRLARSVACGHSGELKISLYSHGLRLRFDGGRLACVEGWMPTQTQWGDAAFPRLTFLQLLFGHRSLGELEYAFPDCWAESDEVRALLDALFPRRAVDLWWVT